jgi:hypothetical protein
MGLAGHVACTGDKLPKGKILLEKSRCKWDDNIETDLRELSYMWNGLIWFSIGSSGGLWVQ